MSRSKPKVELHAHGCTTCRRRYRDACRNPKVDGECVTCRTGKRDFWPEAWEPKDCCREKGRPATKDEMGTYRLAGARLWYICPPAREGCGRTHPFDPRTRSRT